MNNTIEYRDIPGHPGYRAGSDGSVWSINGRRRRSRRRWTRMKAVQSRHGGDHFVYVVSMLSADGKKRVRLVHHLVLEAFIGPRPAGTECCHNDGNSLNNALANLRWDTRLSNEVDRKKHGVGNEGSRHGMSKLTEEQVLEIRAVGAWPRRSHKSPVRALAQKYGVSPSTVRDILRGKYWRHVGGLNEHMRQWRKDGGA